MGIVWSYAVAGWPFVIPNILYFLRTHQAFSIGWLRRRYLSFKYILSPRYLHYRDAFHEEDYWLSAQRSWKILDHSNERRTMHGVPVVRYYTPRLLPTYRTREGNFTEAEEYALTARTFCKWHRMVFQGPRHPTLAEAEYQIKYFSNRDRREMRRITKLATDEAVFEGRLPWTPRYRDMWRSWLQHKGPDIAIIFA